MDYFFSEEQKEIQKLVRKIAEKEIRPVVADYDKSGEFPRPVVKTIADNDIFRVFIEESYGGIPNGTTIFNTVIVVKVLSLSRPSAAAQALGIALEAMELAAEYSRGRRQFGKPLSGFQGIRFLLADMAIQLEAGRSLTYSAARYLDSCKKNRSMLPAAMAKCFASDAAMKIATDALQIYGAYGYVRDYPIEKYLRDAKITQIYEGTNRILRDLIGKSIVRNNAGQNRHSR